jgi:hypothetical protein
LFPITGANRQQWRETGNPRCAGNFWALRQENRPLGTMRYLFSHARGRRFETRRAHGRIACIQATFRSNTHSCTNSVGPLFPTCAHSGAHALLPVCTAQTQPMVASGIVRNHRLHINERGGRGR